jgi:glutamine synthetase adenylyltransferase
MRFHSIKGIVVANSFEAIEQLSRLRPLGKRKAGLLRRNYTFLRKLELAIRLNSESNQFVLPDDKILLQAIAANVGERSARNLREKIKRVRVENRFLMSEVFTAINP